MSKIFQIFTMLLISSGSFADPIATVAVPQQKDYRIPLENSYSVYEDKSNDLKDSNINEAAFEKTNRTNFGRIRHPIWIRVNIANDSEIPQNTSLWLKEAALTDYVDAYEITNDKLVPIGSTGGLVEYDMRPYPAKDLVIPLSLFPFEQKKVLLKVVNRGPIVTHFVLAPLASYERNARIEYIVYSLLFGAILINILYNLLLFFRLRELSIIYYTCYLISLATLFLAINGMGSQLWGADFQRSSTNYGSILTGIFLLLFTKEFLQIHTFYPFMRYIYRGLLYFFVAILAFCFFFPKVDLGKPLLYMDMIVIVQFIYSIILGIKRRFMPAYAFAIGWASFFAGAILIILQSLAVVPNNFLSDYGMHIGAFIQMAFLSLATADRINEAQNEIHRLNEKRQNELESLVSKRTEEMRLILDNVKSAFFRIDSNLTIQPGYTKSCQSLIGSTFQDGRSLTEILELEPAKAEQIYLVLQQVFADVMPERVSLSLMPQNITVKDKHISVQIGAVRDNNNTIRNVIFTLDDATEYVAAQAQREIDNAIISCFQQKSAFLRFLNDAKDLLKQCHISLADKDDTQIRNLLHTIKGNASMFNLNRITNFIHDKEEGNEITLQDLNEIENCMRSFINTYMKNFGIDFDGDLEETFQIRKSEIIGFQEQLAKQQTFENIQSLATNFSNHLCKKSVSDLLGPIDLNVMSLSARLNKKITFEVRGGSILVSQEKAQPIFNTLIHLVRNSLDHGIEPAKERIAAGKEEFGSLIVEASLENNEFILKVIDDGRGIDPKKVGQAAIKRGVITREKLAEMSDKDIQGLIFSPEFSTAVEVSHISGRGVGVNAVVDAVQKNGAKLDFYSEVGQGTIFIITMPL